MLYALFKHDRKVREHNARKVKLQQLYSSNNVEFQSLPLVDDTSLE